MEEEEPAEHYSDEEAPPASGEPNSAAANSPAKEEEAEAKDEDGQSKEESKSEDKGNLAGERQSGDGQVSLDGRRSWRMSRGQKAPVRVDLPVPRRSRPTTRKLRPQERLDRSWTMTRTEKTRPTSPERACSSSTMSGATPRRRRGTQPGPTRRTPPRRGPSHTSLFADPRHETGSCGRTRAAGSTTGSGRRSRPPKAGRSSSPSMATTSATAAALGSARTASADPGEWAQTPPPGSVHPWRCVPNTPPGGGELQLSAPADFLFVPPDRRRLLTETNEAGPEASGQRDPGRAGGRL